MKGNEQQVEAINSNSRTILCLAGAGAGKSFCLVNRILRLVNEGVNPKSILALTFTNAAAFEMGQRYKTLSKGTTQPEFRTFHGFCYSILIKDKEVRERLGYIKVPDICDDSAIKKLKSKAKLQCGCTLSDSLLENPTGLNNKQKFEYELYLKTFKKMLKAENVITFDMLCYNVCALFEKDDPVVDKYKQKYKHILVDEFQDTDPRQFKFLNSFTESTSFFLVGDALQCIYQFRGCSNTYIKALSTNKDWQVIKLYKNYRSTREICNFANKMSTYAKPDYRIEMEGQRDGEDVEVIRGSYTSFNSPVDERHLQKLVDRLKVSETDCAVLCRTNKEVNAICAELEANNIQFSRSNKSTATLDILNSVLDNDYMLNWLATFLEGREYGDYIRLSTLQEIPDIRWFLTTYGKHQKIHDHGKKIIDIRTIVNDDTIDTKNKFDKITKLLKIKSKVEINETTKYTNKQLIESIRDQIEEQEDNKIYVGTVHSSKGLEYSSVYLMGVDDGMFELGTEEMNNLYYVGITRARDHLTIFRK